MKERRDARHRNMMAHPIKRERFIINDFALGLMVLTFCFAITFIAILLARVATGTL